MDFAVNTFLFFDLFNLKNAFLSSLVLCVVEVSSGTTDSDTRFFERPTNLSDERVKNRSLFMFTTLFPSFDEELESLRGTTEEQNKQLGCLREATEEQEKKLECLRNENKSKDEEITTLTNEINGLLVINEDWSKDYESLLQNQGRRVNEQTSSKSVDVKEFFVALKKKDQLISDLKEEVERLKIVNDQRSSGVSSSSVDNNDESLAQALSCNDRLKIELENQRQILKIVQSNSDDFERRYDEGQVTITARNNKVFELTKIIEQQQRELDEQKKYLAQGTIVPSRSCDPGIGRQPDCRGDACGSYGSPSDSCMYVGNIGEDRRPPRYIITYAPE